MIIVNGDCLILPAYWAKGPPGYATNYSFFVFVKTPLLIHQI
jgi:hypothetical protein